MTFFEALHFISFHFICNAVLYNALHISRLIVWFTLYTLMHMHTHCTLHVYTGTGTRHMYIYINICRFAIDFCKIIVKIKGHSELYRRDCIYIQVHCSFRRLPFISAVVEIVTSTMVVGRWEGKKQRKPNRNKTKIIIILRWSHVKWFEYLRIHYFIHIKLSKCSFVYFIKDSFLSRNSFKIFQKKMAENLLRSKFIKCQSQLKW